MWGLLGLVLAQLFNWVTVPLCISLGPSEESPKLTLLIKELSTKVSAKWEDIGLSLDIEKGSLEVIKQDNPRDSQGCFREMLTHWLNQGDPPPTWTTIIDAIDSVDYKSLARQLSEKYVKQ